jgi:DNA-binding transcriptional LysR family regulator
MKRKMTLGQLKIFEVVARHLNLTRAAEEIHVSQPSISKQLRLLEREFNMKFHLRTGQGIQLTERGRIFRQRVESILREIDQLRRSVTLDLKESRNFIVGSTQSPSVSLLPAVLKTLRKTHPEIRPVLRTSDSPNVERMVLRGELEIALVTNFSGNSQLVSEILRTERVMAVIAYTHPLAKKAKLTLKELAKAPFVMRTGGRIAKQLELNGLKLNVVMQCESSEVVKSAVQSGVGLGLLYLDIVRPGLRAGFLKHVEIPGLDRIDVKCSIIYKKGYSLSADAQEFLTLLRRFHRRPCGERIFEARTAAQNSDIVPRRKTGPEPHRPQSP